MKVIICDDPAMMPHTNINDIIFTKEANEIKSCCGCFGCWVKTPGKCVIKDGYQSVGEALGKCDELLIISRCTFGSYSPFVKNVLDRAISYVDPRFTVRDGKMRHRRRYQNRIAVSVTFYGNDITGNEKKTAINLALANAENLDGYVTKIGFLHSNERTHERENDF